MVYGMAFPDPLEGVQALFLRVLGFQPHNSEDDALEPVDSIDIVIVGLGLVLVLLVLLRR